MSDQSSFSAPDKPDTARPLDDLDHRILTELAVDGRLSMRALAEKLHISRANAYARVDRLVADGVILGFGARLNPERAGLGTPAYVMVTIEQNTWREVVARLRVIRYVDHIALVGGDFDILVLVRAPDNAALRHLVLEKIQEIPGVKGTRTWLVFDEATGAGPH
ncbi:Lrp/AsnC family transcriptional regulator [Longispora sp. NPDC051575]|uniref:Lrp/AsnC family transcriptional regulator n=1 Tax=Longispora sp. NPDC051575 TaxID=3154943 RepID=UPI0034309F6C